jgi:choline dehydrogenase-like flavoprotein
VLGGSSSINGAIYNRGGPADYDHLADQGMTAFRWENMLAAYKEIEDNALGATPTRGGGGPLHISRLKDSDPICNEIIAAGGKLGWNIVDDYNESDDERIGYAMCNIKNGARFSAARAFIRPAAKRPNLTIKTDSQAVRLLRKGDRISGVEARERGAAVEHHATREVILCLGCFGTPKLLQLSGVGPGDVLRSAGIDVIVDSPNVGANFREHRCAALQYRLKKNVGYNRIFSSNLGQMTAGLQYLISRRGVMASSAYDVIAFVKTQPGLSRPDAQLLIAPFSLAVDTSAKAPMVEREPGLQCTGYVLRPESRGSVAITSSDPDANLDITPNFLTAPYDRQVNAGIYRAARALLSTSPIAEFIDRETQPGPGIADDEDALVDDTLANGYPCYHGVGTAAMGAGDEAVIDPQLRVRGVRGLRVADASVFPTMVSGNTNAPAVALGWRAGNMILSDQHSDAYR